MATPNLPYFALYGNIRILKAYCPDCRRYAFIINQEFQCCDTPFEADPKRYKRESEPECRRQLPPLNERRLQLEAQDHRCFYCERQFGSVVYRRMRAISLKVHWDHMLPFAYAQDNRSTNFVAACHVCNLIKGSRCFQTVAEATIYLEEKWAEKGYV